MDMIVEIQVRQLPWSFSRSITDLRYFFD